MSDEFGRRAVEPRDSAPLAAADHSTGRERSIALDALRILAVLGVIAIHVFGGIVGNTAIRGSGTWWTGTAVDLGNVWVVPALVMVSGALLLDPRAHARGVRHFYRRRVLRLGPAFVVWQVFYIVVVRMALSGQEITWGRAFQLVADGSVYTHLYFLWLIVGLYVVAPVLAAFLREGGRTRAMTLAGGALAATLLVYALSGVSALHGSPRPIVLGALTQWLPYVGYFVAGWALRRVVLSRLHLVLVASATVLLLAGSIWQYGVRPEFALLQAINPIGYLGTSVALATIGVFLVGTNLVGRMTVSDRVGAVVTAISNASFGAFLVHFFFIVLATVVFPRLLDAIATSVLVAGATWAAIAVLSFGVSILAARVPYLRRLF